MYCRILEDSDHSAFFKDVCFKMQFPNGMDKSSTIIDRMNCIDHLLGIVKKKSLNMG